MPAFSPTPIKLTQPGSSLTMLVQSAAMATVGKYPEMVFTGVVEETGELVSLAMPKSSADRQLARLTLDMPGAPGEVLTFSRDANPSDAAKPYWGIAFGETANLPATGPIVPPRGSQTAKTPPVDDTPPPTDRDAPEGTSPVKRLAAILDLHGACFQHALDLRKRAVLAGQTDFGADAISALTAQTFIAATNRGL